MGSRGERSLALVVSKRERHGAGSMGGIRPRRKSSGDDAGLGGSWEGHEGPSSMRDETADVSMVR